MNPRNTDETRTGIQIGLQSLGFIGFFGFFGFVVGLFGYSKAIAARHAVLASGDSEKVRVLHIMTFTSEILLWGGLGMTLISLALHWLCRRRERGNHDA